MNRNPIAMDEDFIISIEDVTFATHEQRDDDVMYFNKRLFEILKTPKNTLGTNDERPI